MHKFHSIDQFRNTIHAIQHHAAYIGKDDEGNAIYDHSLPKPVITFKGTVKVHGTNCAIVAKEGGGIEYQSRERVLTLQQDNCGFMLNMSNAMQHEEVKGAIALLFDSVNDSGDYVIYGEWCGKGIQKGVGVSQFDDKKMVIFAAKHVKDDVHTWKDISQSDLVNRVDYKDYIYTLNQNNIYLITQFPTYEMTIDFNEPEVVQNALVEITNQIEAECPVAKAFGISGIGEGVVWTGNWNGAQYTFKVKGEKHANSKVKTLKNLDLDEVARVKAFANQVATETRLEQALWVHQNERLLSTDMTNFGAFNKWVMDDIVKEEMDLIVSNQIEIKKLAKEVSKISLAFYRALLV